MILNRYIIDGLECYFYGFECNYYDTLLENHVKGITIRHVGDNVITPQILFNKLYDDFTCVYDIKEVQTNNEWEIIDKRGKLEIKIETPIIDISEISDNFEMMLLYPHNVENNVFHNFVNIKFFHRNTKFFIAQINNGYKNDGIVVFYKKIEQIDMEPFYWFYKLAKQIVPFEIIKLIEEKYIGYPCSKTIKEKIKKGYKYF